MPEKAKLDKPPSGNAVGSRLSLAAKLYSIFGLFAVLTAAITILSDYNTRRNAELTEAIETASRSALNVERVNSLVYAVVMESRGIYMSTEPAVVKKYGEGLIKFNDQILAVVKEWESIVRSDDAELFAVFKKRIEQFVDFRKELVRRGIEISGAAGREWATTTPIAACGPRSTRILKRFPGSMPNAARRSAGKPKPIARWHLS
jgi:methyl-accepting chemotaxis protein